MLTLKIDIVPFGDEKLTKELEFVKIINIKTDISTQDAKYKCIFLDGTELEVKHNKIQGFRKLVKKVLEEYIKNEKK